MAITHTRRRFVTNAAVAGAAGFGGVGRFKPRWRRKSLAAEPPPEISTIRLEKLPVHLHGAASTWPRNCCTRRALPMSGM